MEPLKGLKQEGKELVITDTDRLPWGKPPRKACNRQRSESGPFAQSLGKLHLEAETLNIESEVCH